MRASAPIYRDLRGEGKGMSDFESACKESFERRKSIKLTPWERETLDIIYQVAEILFENGVIAQPVQYKKHRYLMFRPQMPNGEKPITPLFGIYRDRSLGKDENRFRLRFTSRKKAVVKALSDNGIDPSYELLLSAIHNDRNTLIALLEKVLSIPEIRAAYSLPKFTDAMKRKVREAKQRPSSLQAQFKADLLKAYGNTCPMTGCKVAEAMDAAHIIPVPELEEAQNPDIYHPSMGILLRADVHRLVDSKLINFKIEDGQVRIMVDKRLQKDAMYCEYEGTELKPPKCHRKAWMKNIKKRYHQ